jgi:hypothetical protein
MTYTFIRSAQTLTPSASSASGFSRMARSRRAQGEAVRRLTKAYTTTTTAAVRPT